jgi:hypothetical protein
MDRIRTVRKAISGDIVMEPTATELDLLLPRILGKALDVDDVLPETYITIDRVAKVHEYVKCICGQGVLSGSSGEAIRLTTTWEGETETEGNAGTFPEISPPVDGIFVCSDVVLTLAGSPRAVDDFSLTINNMLSTELYRMSLTREEIPPTDREVTLAVTLPYDTDNVDLYNLAIAGAEGTLVIDDGNTEYTFTFANVKIPANSPNVAGKDEIPLQIVATCYADGEAHEIEWAVV